MRPPSLELGTPGLGNREDGTISLRIQRRTPGLYENFMNRKPRRCQAMTVSGLTMTSAVPQSSQKTRNSHAQSHRSACTKRNLPARSATAVVATGEAPATGAEWPAPQDAMRRATAPHLGGSISESTTEVIGEKPIRAWPQHQRRQHVPPFQ